MEANIFRTTNEGKGIIFLPQDNNDHPIVGACLSPAIPALDCIELPGSTIPTWVANARAAAGYDDSCDVSVPPKLKLVSTSTYTLHPYELEAFGGYSLKVNGNVCPLHPTQGIFRSKGNVWQTIKQRVVHEYHYTITRSGGTFDTSTNKFNNVIDLRTHYLSMSMTKKPTSDADKYLAERMVKMFAYYDAFTVGLMELVPRDLPQKGWSSGTPPTSWVDNSARPHLYYGAAAEYIYYKLSYPNSTWQQVVANLDMGKNSILNTTGTSASYTSNQYTNFSTYYMYRWPRYDCVTHFYFYKFEDVTDSSILVTNDISNTNIIPANAPSDILYVKPGIINSGVSYTSLQGAIKTGVHKFVGTSFERDTTQGFLTASPKGLVVTNELRRNFLRISPTVFNHIGGY